MLVTQYFLLKRYNSCISASPKKLKKCLVAYLSSVTAVYPVPTAAAYKVLSFFKHRPFTGCNNSLIAYKHNFLVSNFESDFLSKQNYSQLERSIILTKVNEILQRKDFSTVDIVFLFLTAFIVYVTEHIKNPVLTGNHRK